MTVHIGQLGKPPVELEIAKGVKLVFDINILPACPKLHRDLFEAANYAEKKYSIMLLNKGGKKLDESIEEDDSNNIDIS